jgi:hypothetical protein
MIRTGFAESFVMYPPDLTCSGYLLALEVLIKVVESKTKAKARLNLANLLNIKTPPKLVEGERGLFRKLRKDPTFLRDR